MTALLAHIALFGRHHTTVRIGSLHRSYCNHRSHILRLRCWRWQFADGYCTTHNTSCWASCPETDDPFAVGDIYETDHEEQF
jgi:hypothetical protein